MCTCAAWHMVQFVYHFGHCFFFIFDLEFYKIGYLGFRCWKERFGFAFVRDKATYHTCEAAVLPTVCIQQHMALLSGTMYPSMSDEAYMPASRMKKLAQDHSNQSPMKHANCKVQGKINCSLSYVLGTLVLRVFGKWTNVQTAFHFSQSVLHTLVLRPLSRMPLLSSLSFHRRNTVFLPDLWLSSTAKNWTAQTIQLLLRVFVTALCGVLSTFKSESRQINCHP